jgi:protein-tyrosine phosphatase
MPRERLVALEGTLNFRDLGGYTAADGRTVRWGSVFRSDGLGRLTDTDHDRVAELGVLTICDLRSDAELETEPSRLPEDGIRVVHAPLTPFRQGQKTLDQKIRDKDIDHVTNDDVVELYLQMAEDHAENIGVVLGTIADREAHAVVFHCAAGKDRTGMMAAMLLDLLGVDDEQILFDYMLTNRYRTEQRLAELEVELAEQGLELDPFRELFVPQQMTLERTLATLRDRYGSIEGFVTGPGALDPRAIADIRELLLV